MKKKKHVKRGKKAASPKVLPKFDTTPIPRLMAMVSEGFFHKISNIKGC